MANHLNSKIDSDLKEDLLFNNEKLIIVESLQGSESEPSLLNHLPECLGYAQTFGHDLLSCAPDNLFDSFFQSLYQQGVFEPQFLEIKGESQEEREKRELKDDDLSTVATIMFHGLEDEKIIKSFWPRYRPKRFERNKSKVYDIINQRMPKSFKRFNKIWDELTDLQADAIKLEYFYEETEKPTQKANAKKRGISIASYQDRLELAYKKLSKLYPEFKRIKRRNPTAEDFKEDEYPEKNLSQTQKAEIKKWAREKMDFYFDSQKTLVQGWIKIEDES